MSKFKVGDKIWLFDINRRIYDGKRPFSRCIYAEHFYPDVIDGETNRSYIVGSQLRHPMKFSKSNPVGLYTDEDKENKIWENANRYRISQAILSCSIEQLKAVDNLLMEAHDGKN